MNLIDKHTTGGKFNMSSFTHELAGMTYNNQISVAMDITAPLDYAEEDSHEAIIELNADILATYYRKYLEQHQIIV